MLGIKKRLLEKGESAESSDGCNKLNALDDQNNLPL